MESIKFDFYRNPSKANKGNEEESYHVRINNAQIVDLKELVKRIHKSCSMTPSDVHGVLIALKDEISYALAEGNKVNIDGLCQFRLILGAKKGGKCNGEENARSLGFKNIKISPYKEFNEMTKEKLIPLSREDGKHSIVIKDEEVTTRIVEYIKKNGSITRKKIEEICSLTRYKASQHINRLLEDKILVNIGYKTHPVYSIYKEPTQ